MRALLALGLCLALAGGACTPLPIRQLTSSAAATPSPTPGSTNARLTPEAGSTTERARRARTPRPLPTALAVAAAPMVPAPLNVSLAGVLDNVQLDTPSDYGLVVEDLASGAQAALNADQPFPSASLYKLGVAWLALRQVDAGTLQLDAPLEIADDDTVEPEPDGGFAVGDAPTVREALMGMLSLSSNSAAHAFLRMLGRDAFTSEMDRIGLTRTRVPTDGFAFTTAADIAHLMRLIATSRDLAPASRALLTNDLANVAPPDALRDTLPDSIDIFDKTGNLEDASNVAAVLQSTRGAAILVVLDSGVDPGDARGVIAEAGQAAYRSLLQ